MLKHWPSGHAVLAGGALRDVYFGNTVKDVDIFVHSDHKPQLTEAEELSIQERRSKYDALPVAWIEKRKFLGYKVEVIYVDYEFEYEDDINEFPRHIIKRFDIGLCKIGYTPEAGVVLSPEFIFDRDGKLISIHHETLAAMNMPSG